MVIPHLYYTVCGHSFDVDTFEHFARNPLCRYCKEQKHHFDLEEFRQRVKDLVGDEYEVIEQVADNSIGEKRVKIKHNKCGEEKIYLVKKFLSGSICQKCRTHISKERINIMLDECFNRRYEMVVCDGYKNKLIDKTANKEIFMSTQHILQELLRPTQSPILDIKPDKEGTVLSSWDTWYKLCIEYKEEFGHLSLKKKEKYKGKTLANWCQEQRRLYRDDKLSKEMIEKLQSLGFVFETNHNKA